MTNQSKAYSMYNLGDGILWNEIAPMTDVLDKEEYKVHAVQINKLQYDSRKGELRLEIERPGGSSYPFVLSYDNAIDNFLYDSGINDFKKITELEGRRLIGLFNNNNLEWLIASPLPVTKDDLNQTRIDAGDFSYLDGL